MIEVDRLTRSFGPAVALKGISFEVKRGEVVGFLGPNGAGKSTTMKILTGYLLPTSGGARIAGKDVVRDSLEVRRRIGYLPESTPLYTEMRVDEYLRFAAAIRGVPQRQILSAVARVVEECALQRVVGRSILELSKGYRQRVGLAQAMVHEPDLLILDEPTSGLDPNQIVEVRALIERLGQEHTVILSTHYLQEVEAACSRVIIIDLGEIVADGTRDELVARVPGGALLVRARGSEPILRDALQTLVPRKVVETVEHGRNGILFRIDLDGEPDGEIDQHVARSLVMEGFAVSEITRERRTLEHAFRALTIGRRQEVVDA